MKDFEPYKKPTSVEKVVATIRVDLKTLEEIDKLAGKIDISRNELNELPRSKLSIVHRTIASL